MAAAAPEILVESEELAALAPGTMVDHFKVVRLVGRGGMGEVYLARDTKLGRKVALKLVHPRAIGNEQAVERFLHEARTTAKFSHPHIVAIYFVGEHEERPYVALEYLQGLDLRQRLEARRPGLDETLKIGLAIAEALEEAHRHGVLHRDLKPENVLVPTDGRLRVVDFGLAKAVEGEQVDPHAETSDRSALEQQTTEEDGVPTFQTKGGLKGTPLYMAPEQWGEEEVTSAADVWALGLIFHELLSGRHPYAGLTMGALCANVFGAGPVPPLETEEPIAEALRELVARCLEKDPANRPSASRVAQELRRHVRGADARIETEQSPFRAMAGRDDLRKLCTTLPLPLAELLRRSLNGKSAVEQHHCAFFLAEATLKLAAAARIGLYVEKALAPGSKLAKQLEGLAFSSMGHWVGLLRDVNAALGELSDAARLPMASMAGEMSAKRTNWSAVQRFATQAVDAGAVSGETTRQALSRGAVGFFEVVAAYRNEVMGHGSMRSNAFYEACGSALLAACAEVLSLEALFGGLQLARPERSESGSPQWHMLAGLAGVTSGTPAPGTIPGHVYMHGNGGTVCLHPLLVATKNELGREQIGFLNRTIRRARATSSSSGAEIRRVDYLDYASGETLRAVDAREAVAGFLGQLRDADVALEDLEDIAKARMAESADEGPTEVAADGEVLGEFELLGELGRGGMGVVYQARQLSMNRRVALKVLPPELAKDDTALKRFRSEISALARCDHPNVVKVLTSGSDGARHYYAMEYVDGADLAKTYQTLESWDTPGGSLREGHLSLAVSRGASQTDGRGSADSEHMDDAEADGNGQREPETAKSGAGAAQDGGAPTFTAVAPPPIRAGRGIHLRLAELFADAAAGLAHLHDSGVVHRDIKPANLMLTADASRIVIMDLGLALLEDRSRALTATDVKILGTLMYMAPEQLQRQLLDVDARADIYSLGATLYELVTRRRFFDGDTEARLIQQVLHETPLPARQADKQIPRDLATIIEKATAKRPEHRYASARALENDLRAFARGAPINARPPSAPRRAMRWARRHSTLVASLVLLVIVGSSTGGWLWWRAEHAQWCAAVAHRWSAPECVGPISAAAQARREMTYRLTSREGRVVRIERLNGLGFPRQAEDGFARWDHTYRDDGKLASVVIRDARGLVVRKELYSDDLNRVELRDRQDRPLALTDSEDVSVLARRYDSDGRVAVELYQNVYGAPRGTSLGHYGRRLEHDHLGLVSAWTYLGQDEKPTSGNRAVVSAKQQHNEQGALVQVSWHGHDGELVLDHHGVARQVDEYDEHGNRTARIYFGVDDQPTLSKDGIARSTRQYDERGNFTEEAYFGVESEAALHRYGFARARVRHDERGNDTEQAYFGLDGKPVVSTFGFARLTKTYDAHGNVVEQAYFDASGQPMLSKEGQARGAFTYDEQGSRTGAAYFGVDGRPALTNDGYASLTAKYDERGNNIEVAYFGVDGQPVLMRFGFARRSRTYDERGNNTEEAFFGVDGKSVVTRLGFARLTTEYDERGNVTARSYFGVDGQLVPTEYGDARRTSKYDGRGNRVEEAYFGVDGKPVLTKFGLARVAMRYDERGNKSEEGSFGVDAQPVLNRFGCARTTMGYDGAGNMVEHRCFGVDGNPALMGGFAARRACAFSSSAEIQRCEYFNDADQAVGVLVPDYDAARSVAKRRGATQGAFAAALKGAAGAVVLGVPDQGPMGAVGLKPGDIVARCNGAPVDNLQDLAVCATSTSDPEVALLVIRGDQTIHPTMPAVYPSLLFLGEQ